METNEIQPLDSIGFRWFLVGNQWKPMETNETNGNQWKPMETNEIQWAAENTSSGSTAANDDD